MSKPTGTKSKNIYHRKDFTGKQNNRRITCNLCGVKHYEFKHHYCPYKPNLLDLYCCAGGGGKGYYDAGFNVTGIDIESRPNYFCEFVQADAIEYVQQHSQEYDFIHASPPCQLYSKSTAIHRNAGKTYPDLVAATRDALNATGKPWVMENVPQAPMRPDLLLRGEMFHLRVIRQRIFEFGNIVFPVPAPDFTPISVMSGEAVTIYGKGGSFKRTGHGNAKDRKLIIPTWRLDTVRKTWSFAMGITHYMRDVEISESIPAAYTKFIGQHIIPLLKH